MYILVYVIIKLDIYWLYVSVNGFFVVDSFVIVIVRLKDWIGSYLILFSEDCGGFFYLYSVIVDVYDYVLVVDFYNYRVKIFFLNGEVFKIFGF